MTAEEVCAKCHHSVKSHTIDAPMDVGGCTECPCQKFVAPEMHGDFQIAPDVSGPVQEGPDNVCTECGAVNQFTVVTYHEGDHDLECTQCGSKEFEEGHHSALMRVIEQRDKAQKMADGWEAECTLAQRDLALCRAERSARRAKDHGEVWYWQGDGNDHLETLVCPVLIDPRKLEALMGVQSPAIRGLDFFTTSDGVRKIGLVFKTQDAADAFTTTVMRSLPST